MNKKQIEIRITRLKNDIEFYENNMHIDEMAAVEWIEKDRKELEFWQNELKGI